MTDHVHGLKGQTLLVLSLCAAASACGRGDHIGKAPSFSNPLETREHSAMITTALPTIIEEPTALAQASLWSGQRSSLLGDRRAVNQGDIMTVVIEIDEKAEISNESDRSRSGSESLGIPQLVGLPQRLDEKLPDGASSSDLVSINSNSSSSALPGHDQSADPRLVPDRTLSSCWFSARFRR